LGAFSTIDLIRNHIDSVIDSPTATQVNKGLNSWRSKERNQALEGEKNSVAAQSRIGE
jgi:hypothetical protein